MSTENYLRGQAIKTENAIKSWLYDYLADHEPGDIEQAARIADSFMCQNGVSGLIWNQDLAEIVKVWWSDIDTALDEYHDQTGEWFQVKSVGQMVWFAAEWFMREIFFELDALCVKDAA